MIFHGSDPNEITLIDDKRWKIMLNNVAINLKMAIMVSQHYTTSLRSTTNLLRIA